MILQRASLLGTYTVANICLRESNKTRLVSISPVQIKDYGLRAEHSFDYGFSY